MLRYVIRRHGDNWYVQPRGSKKSYSPFARHARLFKTRKAAQGECCGNDYVSIIYV